MSASAEALANPAAPGAGLLSGAERRWLGVRLTLALITGGLLVLSTVIRIVAPDQQDVAELVAGGAAVLVAFPALAAAWHSLRHPDLHGITDQLIALALIAAWAAGALITAALLQLVMTLGRAGSPISTSRAEGCVDEIANSRMVKRQRMRWSPRGAHRVASCEPQCSMGDLGRADSSNPRPDPQLFSTPA